MSSDEYAAFISYRHGEADEVSARQLQRALEAYRVPRGLARQRGLPRRLGRIFRDDEELAASALLSEAIDAALRRARRLIVVCSRRAPESHWIGEEIRRFVSLGRGDRVLALLIDGEPGEAFPPVLRELGEPLAADIRPVIGQSRRQRFHLAKLRIAAALLGCGFDDLRRRDAARRRRRIVGGGFAVAALAALVVAGVSVMQMRVQQEQQAKLIAQSRAAAEAARQLIRGKNYADAIEAALGGLPRDASDRRPRVTETEEALLGALLSNAVEPTSKTVLGEGVIAGTQSALSPDGRLFVTHSIGDRLLLLYNTADGHELRQFSVEQTPSGLDRSVGRLVFTDDAKSLIAAYQDGMVALYRAEGTADPVKVATASKRFYTLQSAGGRLLVVGDGGCEVFGLATGERQLECGHGYATLSTDGKRIATWGSGQAVLWDVDAVKPLRTLSEQAATVMSAAFAPDGQRLVTGAADGSLWFWNPLDGTSTGNGPQHDGWVTYVGFGPDGSTLITGDFAHAIYGPSFTPEEEMRREAVNPSPPPAMFSPGGAVLAVLGSDVVRVIDTGGTEIGRFHPQNSMLLYDWKRRIALASPQVTMIAAAGFISDDRFLTLDFSTLRVWALVRSSLATRLRVGPNNGACLSDDGSVAAVLYPGSISFTKVTDATVREVKAGIIFPRNGGRLIVVDEAPATTVYDCGGIVRGAWKPAPTLPRQLKTAIGNAWSFIDNFADGALSLSGDDRKIMIVHPSDHLAALLNLPDGSAHDLGRDIAQAVISPDSRRIGTVGQDGTVKVWDADGGNLVCTVTAQGNATALAFASDASRLAIGGGDGQVRIVDAATCATTRVVPAKGAAITFIVYWPDGAIAFGDGAGNLLIEDANGANLDELHLVGEWVWRADPKEDRVLAFSRSSLPIVWQRGLTGTLSPQDTSAWPALWGVLQPGGDLAFTRSADMLRLWSGSTGHLMLSIPTVATAGETEGFSSDGHSFFADLPDDVLLVLRLPSGPALTEIARQQKDD
jgi:WD40 repeat protein